MADRSSASPNRSQYLERGVFSSISSMNLYKTVIEERRGLASSSLLNIKSSKTPIRSQLIPSQKIEHQTKSPEPKQASKSEEELKKLQELVKKLQNQLLKEKKLNEKLEEQLKQLTNKCKTDTQNAEKNIEKLNKTCVGLKNLVVGLTAERDSLAGASNACAALQEEFTCTVSAIIKEVTGFLKDIDKDAQNRILKTLKGAMVKFKVDFKDVLGMVECWRQCEKGEKGFRNAIEEFEELCEDSLASTKGFSGNFLEDIQSAVAIYDFEKEREEDLEFFKGEMIEVLEKNDSGWWIGRIGDRIGSFPFNFVNII